MRLIYAVTFSLGNDVAEFSKRLAAWGLSCGYHTHWLETPEGETPADIATRPLIIYQGEFERPNLGVTLLPPISSVRISYYVSPDATPAEAHKRAADVAADIATACETKLKPALWNLYGKREQGGAPYLHLETGSFSDPTTPVTAIPAPAREETWN